MSESRKFCGYYLAKLFSSIDLPMVQDMKACRALKNILFKAYAFHNNEREKELGCLWRLEKHSHLSEPVHEIKVESMSRS